MTTLSKLIHSDVVRIARKELKPELQDMKKAIASHRSEIALLKRELKSLTAKLKADSIAPSARAEALTMVAQTPRKSGQSWVFKPEALAAKRATLGLTQKEMARLVEASSLSLYKWESGKANPRAAQLVRIQKVLSMGKRQALAIARDGA